MIIPFISLLIGSYFVGAIPTGYWFCKFFYGIDITKLGSGNIGASNVARVKGRFMFAPVFFIDAGKAYTYLYFSEFILNDFCGCLHPCKYIICISLALLIGNAYSLFIKFQGGKGVATSMGTIVYLLSINYFIIFACFWVIILAFFRQVFVASLGAMFLLLAIIFYFDHFNSNQIFLVICIFVWLIFRHQSNIKKWFSY